MKAQKTGFTLAEVLITLGVIGVVAALTMPTMVQNYKKHLTLNRLKKAYSEVNQAFHLSEVDNGPSESWSIPKNTNTEGALYVVENYLLPNLKTAKYCKSDKLDKCGFTPINYLSPNEATGGKLAETGADFYIITASGYGISGFGGGMDDKDNNYSPHLHIYIDTDGPSHGKNTFGVDIFRCLLQLNNSSKTSPKGLGMYGISNKVTREDLISKDCRYGNYCGAVIQYDGWQIKDDYPAKF